MKNTFVILLLSVGTLLTSCQLPTKITVVNRSSVKLNNVLVSGNNSLGNAFSQRVGSIQPGEQYNDMVLNSESKLKLEFDANGKHFTSAPKDFSMSDQITATVAPDFTVTMTKEDMYGEQSPP
jgi:hypothetical protein